MNICTPGLRSRIVVGAVAATLVGAPLASAVAVPPAAPITAFTVEPAMGSWVLGTGPAIVATPPDVGISGYAREVTVTTSGAHTFTAFVAAPTGQDLAVGHYDVNRFGDDVNAGLDLGGDGRGCSATTGTLDIYQLAFDPDTGAPTTFAASYSQNCDGGPANVGELRWNSTVPYERFGAVRLDQVSVAHTVTYTAPEATTVASAELLGDVDAFEVTSDGCTGQSLATGESCAVTVVAHPVRREGTYAYVTFLGAGSTTLGRVSLTATGQETAEGGYTTVSPARILDTRAAIGVSTKTPLGAGKTLALQVTGRGGVPADGVSAAVLNLTVVSPTAAGYLTAYPAGQSRPTASSINFVKGWIGANLVTVPVGTGGKVSIYNSYGSSHVVADIVGFYRSAAATPALDGSYGSFSPVTPTRLVDTRTADWGNKPLPSGWVLSSGVDYGAENNPHIRALALNITAVAPSRAGYLSAWNGDNSNLPTTSTLNYVMGKNVPNMAIVPTQQVWDPATSQYYPSYGIFNKGGSAHVVVDIVGVYDDNTYDQALRFRSITPTRIVDTRTHLGAGPLVGGVAQTVTAPASVADGNTWALVTNTTAVKPTRNCVLTLWASDGSAKPLVSNLNPYAGQIVANMTITGLGPTFGFEMFNSTGLTNAVVDVSGTMQLYPSTPPQPGLRPGVAAGSRLGIAGHPGAAVAGTARRAG